MISFAYSALCKAEDYAKKGLVFFNIKDSVEIYFS